MAERLRRWTRNPLGSPRAGSNPADYVLQFFFFFPLSDSNLLSAHRGLIEILNSTSEEALVQLSVNFTATQAHFGALHTIELEHGGEQRMVTMDNREEFVHKLYNWHLTGEWRSGKSCPPTFNIVIK